MTGPADQQAIADLPGSGIYLRAFLAPLAPWLGRADISEILSNTPGEIWIERSGAGEMERIDVPELTAQLVERLAGQIARISHQAINKEHPLLGATLPTGERVQIVAPTATRQHWALAIRKQVLADVGISDFAPPGGFSHHSLEARGARAAADRHLSDLLDAGNVESFLRDAVANRKSILISGGTSAGKTSLLNALLREIPMSERIIAVEDTPEVRLVQPNSVGLVAVKGELGRARVGVDELLQAALRMRPDRILVGEIRGGEAVTFLRAINTGHPGSITTLHADSPQGALEQVALMVLQSGLALSRADTIAYVRSIIDIIVQVERRDGKRQITDIHFDQNSDIFEEK